MEPISEKPEGNAAKPSKPRRSWRRRLRRWCVILACIYLGLCVLAWLLQSYLVFPGAHFLSADDTRIDPVPGTELLHLTAADGTRIDALFGPALDSDREPAVDAGSKPAVIFFYGNGSCIAGCETMFWHLRELGMNVILPEYPGYGASGGSASEKGCYAAADAAYDELLRRGFTAPGRINIVGWSLGGAVAIDLASRRPVGKLATYDTFTTMHDMGRIIMPWLPTSVLLSYRFDNVAKLPGIHCPVFFVHGMADTLVPPSMEDRLAAAATGAASVTEIKVPGGGHNTIFEVGGDELWARLGRFLNDGHGVSDPPAATGPSDNSPPR